MLMSFLIENSRSDKKKNEERNLNKDNDELAENIMQNNKKIT